MSSSPTGAPPPNPAPRTSSPRPWATEPLAPAEALTRLKEGNERFRATGSARTGRAWSPKFAELEQRPFAVVLGCSDSRTPVEIVFDQGFGDLFVVRVAGNVVAPSIVGSIEFAADQFGTRLVVVMGHSRCGAIGATLSALRSGWSHDSSNIRDITWRIAPHLDELVRHHHGEGLEREAVRANVRASVSELKHGSRLIESLVLSQQLVVVGAEYELETGRVQFFEDAP